ncbi:molybdopterin molybdotransferase MoeA [Acidithrix ferrooxidans]|uniref:Molybdopterin molybdenumtransferase n=1 Tax=Acidithrix ferrooxidans TaxID=1280514 RepID=A0A0D8HGD5_9ACTN|nr:gephyrin-like molybdotransferase Glp [Acidithrix ferrooxidans]KJF16983.1 molybdopterin molybdenumtransferase [Acidithrix ferrooxidans]
MIPLTQAQQYVLSNIDTSRAMAIPIDEANGLITSGSLEAMEEIPPFDNTAVDGIAIRSEEIDRLNLSGSIEVRIAATIAAGSPDKVEIAPGTCVRIMTGAPIPSNCSAVVMIEDVVASDIMATISCRIAPGDNIRRKGSDIAIGTRLFESNTRLTPAHIGVLASVGFAKVPAFRRIKIGVISTGDELAEVGQALTYGKIRDSNRHSLLAIASSSGANVLDLGIVKDRPEDLRKAFLDAAKEVDVIITSGGVSVGDFDYTKAILNELSNGKAQWMQIAIRPAKPFAFGKIDNTPFFGLPGNPVSALVSFELLVKPALRKMQGDLEPLPRPVLAKATGAYKRTPDGKRHFVRSNLHVNNSGALAVKPLDKQGSHMLHEMSKANSLIIVEDGDGFLKDQEVEVLPLGAL